VASAMDELEVSSRFKVLNFILYASVLVFVILVCDRNPSYV